jgi:hypothetical protein
MRANRQSQTTRMKAPELFRGNLGVEKLFPYISLERISVNLYLKGLRVINVN